MQSLAFGQEVLFTVADRDVRVDEFTYIYEKTNRNGEDMYSRASLDEYLELYKKFKLKVARARSMQLDTVGALIDELRGYRKQLATSYLIDKEVSDRLAKELYDRMQKDVYVQQILIKIAPNAAPEDTLTAYKKALEAYQKIKDGASFEQIVKQYSEDSKSIKNGGKLTYVTAMLPKGFYGVESMIYNLKVGELGMPVRSPSGYHVFKKLDERDALGEVEVAHLLIRTDKHPRDARVIADSIYKQINDGVLTFEKAVKNSSEDLQTANKKGYLGFFSINTYDPAFEKAAFAIDNDGGVSPPIFTRFGFHIIKRISARKNEPYDLVRRALLSKIKNDDRYKEAEASLIDKLAVKYKLQKQAVDTAKIYAGLGDDVGTFQWKKPATIGNDPLINIQNRTYTTDDFLAFLKKEATTRMQAGKELEGHALIGALLEAYYDYELYNFAEMQLDREYPEFAALMREYSEGILLFEATKLEVWDKAAADSTGLVDYYEANKGKYKWPPQGELQTLTLKSPNPKLIKKFNKLAKKPVAKLEKVFNKKEELFSVQTEMITEEDLPPLLKWMEGDASNSSTEGLETTILRLWKINAPVTKKLEEAKGYIIADYQDKLEDEWVEQLKAEYPIQVNQDVFEKLVRS